MCHGRLLRRHRSLPRVSPVDAVVLGVSAAAEASDGTLWRRAGRRPRRRFPSARIVHAGRLYGGPSAGHWRLRAEPRACCRTRIARATSRRSSRPASIAALITDCVGIKTGEKPTFLRPVYQGKLIAEIAAEGAFPHLVSVQIGAYRPDHAKRGTTTGAGETDGNVLLDAAPFDRNRRRRSRKRSRRSTCRRPNASSPSGRGIKAQEHIALAEKLAAALGAQLAASRPICDSGWLPMERQVGSSGQTVAPKLYVALGISGAIQHVVGMKGARTIVAINKDADAPIFEIADYGIVGDLFEIVPAMIAELEKT